MKKIVFIHGLESGVHGRKANYLREHYGDEVIVPDLQMSMRDLSRRNGIARSFLRALTLRHGLRGWRHPIQTALQDSTRRCLQVIETALQAEPTIELLIGSSWGGLLCLLLLREPAYRDKQFLALCPALKQVWQRSHGPIQPLYEQFREALTQHPRRVIVVHGDKDDVIPIEDSIELCEAVPQMQLVTIPGGGHALRSLTADDTLQNLIHEHFVNS